MKRLDCKLSLLDIGASGGYFKPFKEILENTIDVLIEPSTFHYEKLKANESKNYIIINKAVGSKEATQNLYDPEVGGASLYNRNNDVVLDYIHSSSYVKKVSVEQIRLESVGNSLKEANITKIDAVKIDTQGSEFEILKGLKESGYLKNLLLIQIEIPSIPSSYINQPKMSEVIKFAEDNEFFLLSMKSNCAHKLVQKKYFAHRGLLGIAARSMDIDALFIKPSNYVLEQNTEEIEKYIVLLCAFKYFLEAQSVVEKGLAMEKFSTEKYHFYMEYIKKKYQSQTPRFIQLLNAIPMIGKVRSTLNTIFAPIFGSFQVRKFPHGN